MAKKSAEQFVNRMREDAKLRAQYASGVKQASEDVMMQLGRSAGFDFTVEELRAVLEKPSELSDDQLEQVVGGATNITGDFSVTGGSSITGDFSNKKL